MEVSLEKFTIVRSALDLNLISKARLISAGADVVKRADTKTAQVVVDDVVVIEAKMRDGLFFVEKVLDEHLTLQKYASRYC